METIPLKVLLIPLMVGIVLVVREQKNAVNSELKVAGTSLIAFGMIPLLFLTSMALVKGAPGIPWVLEQPIARIAVKNHITPTPNNEQPTPDTVTILYRYECPACKVVYAPLKEAESESIRINWVRSRSDVGKTIVDRYGVPSVPTALYIDGTSVTQRQLVDSEGLWDQRAYDDIRQAYLKGRSS